MVNAGRLEIRYRSIGKIHSPFHTLEAMPIQPSSDSSKQGTVEIYPEYADGLKDLAGFSHMYLLYHLHKAQPAKLLVIPFLDDKLHGIFATRAPSRPNQIGLSLVEILGIDGNLIHVDRLDIVDETPLLDIKPYIPEFEDIGSVRIGWLEQAKGNIRSRKSDRRFV